MLNNTLKYFEELSKIPRCSKNESAAIARVKKWADKKWYSNKIDELWNILVVVPATSWYEDKQTVVLQSHIDMVCVKTPDSKHDFNSDAIKIVEKDGFWYWDNTTLWADNGIWLAMAMAASHLTRHAKLELFFTVDEEQWMSWAIELKEWFVNGSILINLDSEDEWEITIWSAWGSRIEIKWNYESKESKLNAYDFKISWIKWGHSWVEIHKSLWNAIDAFFKLLDELDVDFQLGKVNAWIAENVIPKELTASICMWDIYDLGDKVNKFVSYYKKEYNEPNFNIQFSILDNFIDTISSEISSKIKDAIILAKSWVYNKSREIDDFVLTSQNLWIIKIDNWSVELQYLSRSSIEDELDFLISQKNIAFSNFMDVKAKDPNPGWAESIDSDLIKTVQKSYEKITKKPVRLIWVHAWLECGAIINKMPSGSKAVSIWPNIFWAHTVNERCELRSVWILCDVLEDILIEL